MIVDTLFNRTGRPRSDPFDMGAGDDDPATYPDPLRKALEAIHGLTRELYVRNSSDARVDQRTHRRLTFVSLTFGSTAIIIAIIMLLLMAGDVGPEEQLLPFSMIEAFSLLIALISIVVGLYLQSHTQWLCNRHVAEQLRLMKFRFLIDPRLWCGDARAPIDDFGDWTNALVDEKNRIEASLNQGLEACMTRQPLPDPPMFICTGYPDADLEVLVGYYLERRLGYQREYFEDKIKEIHATDVRIRRLPELLFFASVGIVLIHFSLDLLGQYRELSTVLIGFAAIFPIIGLSIKSYRSANQMATVATSYIAKLNALTTMESRIRDDLKRLETARLNDTPFSWEGPYWKLVQCETLLAAEHHGWLIMMHEHDITP